MFFSKLEVSDVQAKLLKHAGVEGVEPVVKKERSQSRERSHSRASSASSKGSKDRKGRYVTRLKLLKLRPPSHW